MFVGWLCCFVVVLSGVSFVPLWSVLLNSVNMAYVMLWLSKAEFKAIVRANGGCITPADLEALWESAYTILTLVDASRVRCHESWGNQIQMALHIS